MNRCETESITAERGALAPCSFGGPCSADGPLFVRSVCEKTRGLTPPAQRGAKQGEPRRNTRRGSLQKSAAAPDGQPVGCVSAATSGYHYTLDHLLSLETPCDGRQPTQPFAGPSPSCR